MARELEYLDDALEEAEAAARWYAERGGTYFVVIRSVSSTKSSQIGF